MNAHSPGDRTPDSELPGSDSLVPPGNSRTFWLVSLAAAALVTAIWCALAYPAPAFPYSFQVEIQPPTPTVARLYYERGAGIRDSESAKADVPPLRNFAAVTLPLPAGKYRTLYFTPASELGSAKVRFRHARIVSFDGRVMRTLLPQDFAASAEEARPAIDGEVIELAGIAGQPAPRVVVKFDPILRLGVGFWSTLSLHAPRALKVFGLTFAVLVLARIGWVRRGQFIRWATFLRHDRPRLALAGIAVMATSLSSYPVIFFGKSLVSPTSGSVLLYDRNPTLPGFTDLRQDDVHSSDVGAMMWQHLPYAVLQHRALAAGELPLWNRYSSTGIPLLGQGQSMFGDPFHLPVIAAGGAAGAFDAKFIWAKLLFACGVGWCAWALTRDFAASALAVLASALVGFFSYRFNHPAIFSLGYAPWILVSWLEITNRPGRAVRGWSLWLAANFCEITSGTVKEAYVLCLALNCAGLLVLTFSSATAREKLRALGCGLLMGVALVLITAPVWWSFFHALGAAATSYDVPTVLQIRREWFIGFFDDLFYREMTPRHAVYMPAANFLVLLGVFFAVLEPARLWKNSAARSLALVALLAFGLAFQTGSTESAPQWMLQLPLFRNLYHVNNLFSCVALVLVCVLAGWGFSRAREILRRGGGPRAVVILAAGLTLLFLPYFLTTPPGWTGHHWRRWADADLHQRAVYLQVLLLPLALGILVVVATRRIRLGKWTAPTLAAAALALLLVLGRHGQHLPFFPPNVFLNTPGSRPELFAPSPAVDFLREATAREPGRAFGLGNTLFPGFSSVYEIEGINGPDAIVNRRYRELVSALGLLDTGWQIRLTRDDFSRWAPALDFLNVSHVATEPGESISAAGYHRVAHLDLDVWRSEHAWPRAFFVDRLGTYDTPGELAHRIQNGAGEAPFACVQSSDVTVQLKRFIDPESNRPRVIPAMQYQLQSNRTSFTITAPSAGIAVLHEAWVADDFAATVDGNPVPYLRINHAFKGVLLPAPGTHRIEFSYRPATWTRSLILGLTGLLIVTVVLFRCWRTVGFTRGPGAPTPVSAP